MRCRQIVNGEVVWFGSIGLDKENATTDKNGKTIYPALKETTFVDKQSAVASSLTQRLSVIKRELWYKMSYGLPLFDKIKSKVFMDSEVTNIILDHPDVLRIENFSSHIIDKKYTFDCQIVTKYGNLDLKI